MKGLFILLKLLCMFLLILVFSASIPNECTTDPTANCVDIKFNTPVGDSLTQQNVYNEILRQGIKFPETVLRQSLNESAHYKSYNCLKRSNLFGMKGGKKTESNVYGYAVYDHWKESVSAYQKWQLKRLSDTVTDYYQFLLDFKYHEAGKDYKRICEGIKLHITKN